ncbi:indole-3-glycerol phosphate synthase TrpC [Fructilactobacillus vespulae]|uniref:indole-3-glycerol phosphate synthase TrpC n=1 Tax=Fructilactobacillus vespulae TaxID=1249630 RepID=UPI0039B3A1D1
MILDDLTNATKKRISIEKKQLPFTRIKKLVAELPVNDEFLFEKQLQQTGLNYICEIKRASPSKGDIKLNIDVESIAKSYEEAGAAAISVLTEPQYFKGNLTDLEKVVANVSVPVLRKDFTIDSYMIYQAKLAGASAVLLICAILTDNELKKFFELANKLGISAIFEAHDEREIKRALAIGARIIGVNNRNLKNFTINLSNARNLRKLVPKRVLFISESGVKSSNDIDELKAANVNGVLIGETMMLAKDKKKKLLELSNGEN